MATRVDHHGHGGHVHPTHPTHPVDPLEPGGRQGVHGMILFGTAGSALLSHIPMMHEPHDVQLILEAKLNHPSLANKQFGDGLFTLVPEAFSLDDLRAGTLTSFKAAVFSGNFENGGRKIAENVVVEVKARKSDAQLDPTARPDAKTRFLAYGTPTDAYFVKRISGSKDYDQVLRLTDIQGLDAAQLAAGVDLELNRKADVNNRLKPGDVVTLRVRGTSQTVTATIGKELSVLVGPDFVSGP